ncbi:hypothetical protein FLAN108750_00660 [Flavobacterium antarcticum]|uniref:hypothetical protein n=1 Tax=Flavobacterium antarcticum TaxID=271155 RepID=UPI0003B5DA44|nr:hypothetical protein [Flavobacterium antarcticum]
MLQVIITATLLITGLLASEKAVNQTHSTTVEICLETNGAYKKTDFHSKKNTHLFANTANLKYENERETI